MVINEDYWNINEQQNVYLIYGKKYSSAVISGNNTYERWIDADQFVSPSIKTISIYIVSPTTYNAITEFMYMSFTLNNSTGSAVFSYSADDGTNWINVTIYRINGTARELIYQGNYSSNSFTISIITNVSMMHIAFVNVSHDELPDEIVPETGKDYVSYNGNHRISIVLKAFPIGYTPNWNNLDTKLNITFGSTEISYVSMIIAMLVIFLAFTFGPDIASLGMIISGIFIIFMNKALAFSGISLAIAILFVVLGIILLIPKEAKL